MIFSMNYDIIWM